MKGVCFPSGGASFKMLIPCKYPDIEYDEEKSTIIVMMRIMIFRIFFIEWNKASYFSIWWW